MARKRFDDRTRACIQQPDELVVPARGQVRLSRCPAEPRSACEAGAQNRSSEGGRAGAQTSFG